jgi:WD40 repeat protein
MGVARVSADPAPADEPFADFLAACDSALDLGGRVSLPAEGEVSPELRRRLERGVAGLHLLRQLRRRPSGELPSTLPGSAVPVPAGLPWTELGRFQVRRELGRGGFGMVFLAYDPLLGREVALKVPRAELAAAPEVRERFRREAQAAAGLDHPNLVPVYEAGAVGPVCFLVSAYCAGPTLAQWLKHRSEPIPFRLAAQLLATLADAVHHAHARDVLHRDLKPANILLSPLPESGLSEMPADRLPFVPRVADFGLAKLLQHGPGDDHTRTGTVLGTTGYMAPEQALGNQRAVGPPTDVYALGAILYELLAGRPPFQGESDLDILRHVQSDEPVAPSRLRPRVPRDLETICLKCLEKEPRRRYPSARALADDLGRYLRAEPIQARPVGTPERVLRWCRRKPAVASLTGAVAVLLVLLAVGGTTAAISQHRLRLAAEDSARHEAAQRALAEEARNDQQAQRRRAEELLERQYVANAVRQMESADPADALPWIAGCLRLSADDPARQRPHRDRFAAVLRQRPRALQAWFHDGPVHRAIFSADGRRVATAGHDGTARVWDSADGAPVTPPIRTGAPLRSVQFSADGRYLLTVSLERGAEVWDAATGARLGGPPSQGVSSAALSPDGRRVVTANGEAAQVWDTAAGAPVMPPLKHAGGIYYVAFSPDGRWLVTGGQKVAQVWDSVTGSPVTGPLAHLGRVYHAAFSPDGTRMVTAAYPDARVWDTATGRQIARFREHVTNVVYAAFSPDGARVVTASQDWTAQVWDTATGKPTSPPLKHGESVDHVEFSPHGSKVVTASADGTARIWDAATGAALGRPFKHAGPVSHASFSSDGTRILTAGEDGTARLWLAEQAPTGDLDHRDFVFHASFSADGRRVATASWDGTARVWDSATARPLTPPLKHLASVRRASFSPDGRLVATASLDHTARVWESATGRALATIRHTDEVFEATFHPDGRRLLTSSVDGTARVWEAATGAPLTPPMRHAARVSYAEFSSDGRRILTASWDTTACAWDADSGKLLATFRHPGRVFHAAFDPDGRRVVTSGDGVVQVWDAVSGSAITGPAKYARPVRAAWFSPDGRFLLLNLNEVARVVHAVSFQPIIHPLRHQGIIHHVEFSRDGRFVLTASVDGTARVWDAATGEPITPALRHGGPVWYAAFSPDTRKVVTAAEKPTARLWDLASEDRPVDDLVRLAGVLSGMEVGPAGELVPIDPARLRQDWVALGKNFPRELPCSRAD